VLRRSFRFQTSPGPHQLRKQFRLNLVQRHHMAVRVEAHRGSGVAGALGELACDNPGLVPDRDPAVTEIVGE
jgi:hypothetical protein